MKSGSIWNPSRVPTSQIVTRSGSRMPCLLAGNGRTLPRYVRFAGSRPNIPRPRTVMTTSPCWFSISVNVRTMPRSGLLREGTTSVTVKRARTQRVAGMHRLEPADLVASRRAERHGVREERVPHQPHHDADRLPPAGDEPPVERVLGRGFIGVE